MTAMYDAAMERLDEILAGIDLDTPAGEPRMKEMLITKAAVTTVTERGEFTAIISTEKTDREGDVVLPEAMVAAIQAWNVDGKQIPLAWAHRTEPDELIGSVDPTSVKAENGEVIVSAWIDRDIPRGREVWRLVKSGTLGFSFGYLITDAIKRANGDREIRGLDIFEISATATPMNRGTRVLDWKSTEQPEPEPVPTPEELRARSRELERELGLEDPKITLARTMGYDWMTGVLGRANADNTEKAL